MVCSQTRNKKGYKVAEQHAGQIRDGGNCQPNRAFLTCARRYKPLAARRSAHTGPLHAALDPPSRLRPRPGGAGRRPREPGREAAPCPGAQNGHTSAAARMRKPGHMGACQDSMPGRSSTVASTSSVRRSRPPRIGFSISGLVCVSPSYSTSSTCARVPLRQRRQGGVRVRVKPPRARPAPPADAAAAAAPPHGHNTASLQPVHALYRPRGPARGSPACPRAADAATAPTAHPMPRRNARADSASRQAGWPPRRGVRQWPKPRRGARLRAGVAQRLRKLLRIADECAAVGSAVQQHHARQPPAPLHALRARARAPRSSPAPSLRAAYVCCSDRLLGDITASPGPRSARRASARMRVHVLLQTRRRRAP